MEFAHASLAEAHLGTLLFKLLRLLNDHGARFPTHLIWLFKSVATLEDVSRRIDPGFRMLEFSRPYARRLGIQLGCGDQRKRPGRRAVYCP